MVEAFYGPSRVSTAIIADQLGSFFVLSVLGIMVAGIYSSGRPTALQIFKRIALFPPFISLIIALLLIPFEYADWLSVLLKRLGDTLAPLALLSVGMQLRMGHLAEHKRNLLLGLGFKLVLAPLAIMLLYVPLLGAHGQVIQVTLFEAAMPPMISAAIVATDHELDTPLVNIMVAIGLILAFFTLPIWWWAMQGI
jgi:predicted permease